MYQIKMEWMDKQIVTLADIIPKRTKVLFVGLNPAPLSVEIGHYHQGNLGQQFWHLLEKWKILPKPTAGLP